MQAIAQTVPASHDHAAPVRTMQGDARPERAVVPMVGNQARLRALSRTTPRVQAKLEIGAADDPLEHEADQVAEQVMRMAEPQSALTRALNSAAAGETLQRKCAGCKEEDRLHRKAEGAPVDDMAAPPITHDVLQPPVQPLDAATRALMEPRFGLALSRTTPRVQAKLVIGAADDPLEHEADNMADRVMRMPDPAMLGAPPPEPVGPCLECEEEGAMAPDKVQASGGAGFTGGGEAPASVLAALQTSGQPLDPAARAFLEPRFGRDFAGVRVHTGADAAAAAAAVSARAFTVGEHIAFAEGAYAPNGESGLRLLAHELTHVAQQSSPGAAAVVSRDLVDDAKKKLQDIALGQLRDLGNKPLGPPSGYSNSACPKEFCQPFADKVQAIADLAWAGPLILAGIAIKVNSRVVPFWATHLAGGAASQNISADFGADFTKSATTAKTTKFLVGELRNDAQANATSLLGGAAAATVDFTPRLTSALSQIDDQSSSNPMDFDFKGEIPGNLAGGIGKDETKFPIGATPSPFNDARAATISATLTKQASGDILVAPAIQFTVADTVDLCPGNCGDPDEQAATIPLSRFEATGLSGDVPFTVQFPAPAAELTPFTVTPAPTFPKTGKAKTTAKLLRVRSGAGLKFPVVQVLAASGTSLNVTSQAHAEVVNGNDVWDKVDGGWVSDAYVAFEAGP